MATPLIRPARPAEAAGLTELVLRSKAHWGYDQAFMDACRAELTLAPEQLTADRALVAERADGVPVGFALLGGSAPEGELDMLFVDPAAIGTGVGGRLYRALLELARAEGFERLSLDADPYAVGFYAAMGARPDGESPSASIPGRVLPRFAIELG
ncbi:GNAT family N-acetyltransferase [Kitasatospora viridis]|uniref:Acetyltransferase (GNAT) family protein n=1 Tax=Kitasatospora viridis TaxID=281105 RepID=A0A561UDP0_9ACTN|nr:GNAT family N-acetyltransferase [Kitasatospora viridis]TWF97474.1 acetyltransferase (GNAT) family protein [Kitasatospora viridis]